MPLTFRKRPLTPQRVTKMIFKTIAALIIITTCAILFFRIFSMGVPSNFKKFLYTEEAVAAKEKNPDFLVKTFTPLDTIDEKGYYSLSDAAFCPGAGEVQFVFRYNTRSTVNALKDAYRLDKLPDGELFIFILHDDCGNTYTSYRYASASRTMNEFRRVIFDGVSFENVHAFTVDIYYRLDVSDESPMGATFTLWNEKLPFDESRPAKVKPSTLSLRATPDYENHLTKKEEMTE